MCDRMKVPVPRAHSSPSRVDDSCLGYEHPPFAEIQRPSARVSPPPHRLGEMEVERGGQQEAVADQAVGRVEGRIVEHLEVECTMGSTRGVEALGLDREADLAPASLRQDDVRLEQPVDRRGVVKDSSARKCASCPLGTGSGRIPLLGAHQHRSHGIPGARAAQLLDDPAMPDEPADRRQGLEMLRPRVGRRQQQEYEIDRLAIDRLIIDRRG